MRTTTRSSSGGGAPGSRIRIGIPALLLALPLALLQLGCGDGGVGAAGSRVAVVGGWIWDGTGNQPEPNRGILIQDSVFVRVGSELRGSDLAGATLIRLTQEDFILPGLFDLHAHYAVDLYGEGRVDDDQAYPTLFLANGVTSTYPAGEIDPVKMQALRVRIENGEQVGPRLFNSGPYFGTARQGWDQEITAGEIRSEVDHWYAEGVRNFKAKGIRPGHLQALIDAAHSHGATVTAHLDSGYRNSVNPRDAIAMGLDRVEHFLGGDALTPDRSAYASLVEMTPDMPEFGRIAQLYIDNGVYFDATLSAYGYYGERDPEVYTYFEPEMDYLTPEARAAVESRLPREVNQQFERIYWVKRELIKAFYDMGGGDLITLGTDHPSWGEYFTPFSIHRELHTMVLAGLPPAAALRTATINAARALQVEDRLGTVEPGKLADLVIVTGNPLSDIRNTRHVHTVIRAGTIYDSRKLMDSVKGKLDVARAGGPD
ncbi:MAG: amidohydrolase family protein [Longimicrobiales bacterium]|nr:amidohydrolase family protein [Longimicrobiales bacterium]